MKVTSCRLCGGQLSDVKLDLGLTPLANEFLSEKTEQEMFPLNVASCNLCQLFQLTETIDFDKVFGNYVYVAGTCQKNVAHFADYAKHVVEKFNLQPGSKILEIASNDGTLLKQLKSLGMDVLGIDPAKNIVDATSADGIQTICKFFTHETAKEILNQYGQFDLLIANNVLAHIPDIGDVLSGVKLLMKPTSAFVFEVSYFNDVCDKVLFDTIYHEHQSLMDVFPIKLYADNSEMSLFDVELIPNHGGSIRVFLVKNDFFDTHKVTPKNVADEVQRSLRITSVINNELNGMSEKVSKLKIKIDLLKQQLTELLKSIKDDGKKIAIYGMPAKATTLMYVFDIDPSMIEYAVDDNPLKQNTFSPGKHVAVYSKDKLKESPVDYMLVLAWNFADAIIENNKDFNGKWIVPIPELIIT